MRMDDAGAQVAAYLHQHETKDLLRFITCGSVDDGKSTLIGRLLHDTRLLLDDQVSALEADSRRHGTQGEEIDFALLVDGLAAEREQGITIDVAYRFFDTERRKFIVADCPGHEQYTRNMATGASTADVAVVLVDARKGLLTQTRRHSYIVKLLGIERVLLAVNKMDLVGFDEAVFDRIADEYRALAAQLGIAHVDCIPVSALRGDNMVERSRNTPWYGGPALLELLETVPLARAADDAALRMPVQWVCRPNQDFRGFAGTIAAGTVKPGDGIVVLPSGRRSQVAAIVTADGELPEASAGQAVTLTLCDEIDVSRGDVIASAANPPEVADQFAAHLLWMGDARLLPGRPYLLQIGSRTVGASVTEIKHKVDVNTQDQLAAKHLDLNEVGYCNLHLDQPVPFAAYAENRALGAFILIDRQSNATVAAGTLDFALRRAGNIHWQHLDVDKAARAAVKHQTPRCLWFTGLSGAGKSTLAHATEERLHQLGCRTFVFDGDNVRHGLCSDLGFSAEDREENIRRVGEMAKLFLEAGVISLTAFISPFRKDRERVRSLVPHGDFLEVYCKCGLEVCESRDVKGLYKRARAGEIKDFTGISSPYEEPEDAEIVVETGRLTLDKSVDKVLSVLLERGVITTGEV